MAPRAVTRTAFELLLDIDQRCRQRAASLPSQPAGEHNWSGIGFRLGPDWYVAPMAEVAEVLPVPPTTRVPGVKPWVAGIANVRGRLLPLVDLNLYLQAASGPDTVPDPVARKLRRVLVVDTVPDPVARKLRRVLVVDTARVYTGLLVDEVGGLQHFPADSLQAVDPLVRQAVVQVPISAYLDGRFERERTWDVFSPASLVQAPAFLNVALQTPAGQA
jgi:twitching motility protein PilI